MLPKYDCLRYDRIYGLTVAYHDLWVPWYSGSVHCTVYFGFVDGRKCFFIEPHSPDGFFDRGHMYGSSDDIERFAFFSKAALEFMLRADKRPEIIHCHDWQTALVPVLLYELYQPIGMHHQRVCFTAHNFSHQGVTGDRILWATGLRDPARYFDRLRLGDNVHSTAINLLKGGIVYSNFVTTVSPGHAWEVRYSDHGCGSMTRSTCTSRSSAACRTASTTTCGTRRSTATSRSATDPTRSRASTSTSGPCAIDSGCATSSADRRLHRAPRHQKGVHLIHHAIFFALEQGPSSCCSARVRTRRSAAISGVQELPQRQPDVHLELQFNTASRTWCTRADLLVMPSMSSRAGSTSSSR